MMYCWPTEYDSLSEVDMNPLSVTTVPVRITISLRSSPFHILSTWILARIGSSHTTRPENTKLDRARADGMDSLPAHCAEATVVRFGHSITNSTGINFVIFFTGWASRLEHSA